MINKKKKSSEAAPGNNPDKISRAKSELPKKRSPKKQVRKKIPSLSVLKELNPSYAITSRLRPIGNSKGVILPNRVIEEAQISPDADIIIQVCDGLILIAESKLPGSVNTDLSSWDKQFKSAIKKGNKPEPDVWNNLQNGFEEEDWT